MSKTHNEDTVWYWCIALWKYIVTLFDKVLSRINNNITAGCASHIGLVYNILYALIHVYTVTLLPSTKNTYLRMWAHGSAGSLWAGVNVVRASLETLLRRKATGEKGPVTELIRQWETKDLWLGPIAHGWSSAKECRSRVRARSLVLFLLSPSSEQCFQRNPYKAHDRFNFIILMIWHWVLTNNRYTD